MKPRSKKTTATASTSSAPRPFWIAVFLGVAVLAVYFQVAGFGYVNLDDPAYVTENPHVTGGLTLKNFRWAFQAGYQGNWHPLTWLSHMLDAQCFGASPTGPHLVNLALHIASTILLFWTLLRLTSALWKSALVAALFGLHPLHVESVAWIAERKDVLSGFFFTLTLWAYARYVHEYTIAHPRRKKFYALALVVFALGLMSKSMLVTVPFVLLLLDFWPLKRLRMTAAGNDTCSLSAAQLAIEKLPFFALAAISSLVTVAAQRSGGAVQSLSNCPLDLRLQNAVVSYARYLAKTFWPFNLATPYPEIHPWPALVFAAALASLVAITILAVRSRHAAPSALTGWFWFCGMLVPVIGIVQVGGQAMADRYTYLPLIGLFIACVWNIEAGFIHFKVSRSAISIITALILAACAVRTGAQLRYWKNTESLLSHAVAVTDRNWMAHYNLAWELERAGRLEEAQAHYQAAAEINSNDADALNNLGNLLVKKGDYTNAISLFTRALKAKPAFTDLEYNIASASLHLHNFDDAITHYRLFLQHHPEHLNALNEMGVAYGFKGELDQAIARFREALRVKPDDAQSHFNLGEALSLQGKVDEARTHFKEALRLKPGWPEAARELQVLETTPP